MSSPQSRQLETELGLHMPAEWMAHDATWIAWPHERLDWPGKFHAIPWVYCEIVRNLSRSERVHIEVNRAADSRRIGRLLDQAGVDRRQVKCWVLPSDRVWTRDHGPIFVHDKSGNLVLTDWRFNAWAKYGNWRQDNRVPQRLARKLKLPVIQPRWEDETQVVLEGGSIDVNGAGCLLTTEECLLSKVQERNPGHGQQDYEAIFAQFLGIKKTIWLNQGICGDDTHGHVDDLARFVNPTTIVLAQESRTGDPNYRPLRDNWERLQGVCDGNGSKIEVIPLPMPGPQVFRGQRLPASYANFYIANRTVLVPTFNDPADRIALGILAELFPDRKVIGIHSVDLVWGLGTLHCLTQQQPSPISTGEVNR